MRGRPPYAPGLADALAVALELDGTGRLLDVGCGPGVIALRLAHLFEEAVGLDPDQGMLDHAARLASEQHVGNVTWVRLRAEELPADLPAFRVVTFAASFHWMDRPRVARAVRSMLDRGGAAVQIDAPAYRPDEASMTNALPHPLRPQDAITRLRHRYLGTDTRAGQGIRNTSPSGEDAVFRAAGFLAAVEVAVADDRVLEQTIDDVVAGVFSLSASAPHLFGPQIGRFESDLRDVLRDASPSGLFSAPLSDNILRIWRLPS